MIAKLRSRLLTEPGPVDATLHQSSVLVALDTQCDEPSVLLTRRADHLRLHAGEVAFPGGRCDPEDVNPWATAVREAEEEVALRPVQLKRLGYLDAIVTRTGIQVIPCVAELTQAVQLKPNPEEIASVFYAPLGFFAMDGELHLDEFVYGERVRGVPRYEFETYTIWGITAAILVRLVNLGLDAGLSLEDYWKGADA